MVKTLEKRLPRILQNNIKQFEDLYGIIFSEQDDQYFLLDTRNSNYVMSFKHNDIKSTSTKIYKLCEMKDKLLALRVSSLER